jgi:hypothetical protein
MNLFVEADENTVLGGGDPEEKHEDESANLRNQEENTYKLEQSDLSKVTDEVKKEKLDISDCCQDNNSIELDTLHMALLTKKKHSQPDSNDPEQETDKSDKANSHNPANNSDQYKTSTHTGFSKTSILKLRTHLMEVIEELKMRRVSFNFNIISCSFSVSNIIFV